MNLVKKHLFISDDENFIIVPDVLKGDITNILFLARTSHMDEGISGELNDYSADESSLFSQPHSIRVDFVKDVYMGSFDKALVPDEAWEKLKPHFKNGVSICDDEGVDFFMEENDSVFEVGLAKSGGINIFSHGIVVECENNTRDFCDFFISTEVLDELRLNGFQEASENEDSPSLVLQP